MNLTDILGLAKDALGGVADEITSFIADLGKAFVEDAFCGVDMEGALDGAISGAINGGLSGGISGAISGGLGGLIGSTSTEAYISGNAYIKAACEQAKAIKREAVLDAIIMVAYSLFDIYVSHSITNMQQKIADAQMKLAEELHDHRKKYFPYEKKYVDDAFGIPKPCPSYAVARAYISAFYKDEEQSYKDFTSLMDYMHRDLYLADMNYWSDKVERSAVDIGNFALRVAEAISDALDDVRYARRYSALKLGRSMLDDVLQFNDAWAATAVAPKAMVNDLVDVLAVYARNKISDNRTIEPKMRPQAYAPMPTPS